MPRQCLRVARVAKQDEFYTQFCDIEKELINYEDFFRGKTVYCNCDDYRFSNFVLYFKTVFNRVGLKKLVATNYDIGEGAWKYEYDWESEKIEKLDGDGSFDSTECVELLDESDVIVTNPPFSKFKQYMKQLIEHNKSFLIIGNQNAVTYKDIFPYIRDNKIWFGVSIHGSSREFMVHSSYVTRSERLRIDEDGNRYVKIGGVRWFTNIKNKNRNTPLILSKTYNPEDYPKYDNYDAIDVSRTCDIPKDYDGIMGVPITFLDKYCPYQFEIIDINPHFYSIVQNGLQKPRQLTLHNVGKKDPYARLLIRKKE